MKKEFFENKMFSVFFKAIFIGSFFALPGQLDASGGSPNNRELLQSLETKSGVELNLYAHSKRKNYTHTDIIGREFKYSKRVWEFYVEIQVPPDSPYFNDFISEGVWVELTYHTNGNGTIERAFFFKRAANRLVFEDRSNLVLRGKLIDPYFKEGESFAEEEPFEKKPEDKNEKKEKPPLKESPKEELPKREVPLKKPIEQKKSFDDISFDHLRFTKLSGPKY